jgi:hypothetical protein
LIERCGLEVAVTEGLFFATFTTVQIQQLGLSDAILQDINEVEVDYPELCSALMTTAVSEAETRRCA